MGIASTDRNTLWASLFVDELARGGLRVASIVPGSRSTPLTLAFAAHPGIDVYVHGDERSAAFFALGVGLAGQAPAVVVCTSGTAAANFYPAVIEAFQAGVPLVVLTADRPHEQRDGGANQTIDQVKLYGGHVRWSVDVAPPEADPPGRVLRYLRTLACRALATAGGLHGGPVHLNFPFRKPLEPTSTAGDPPAVDDADVALALAGRPDHRPWVAIVDGALTLTSDQVVALSEAIHQAPRGLIVCGPRSPGGAFPAAVARLAAVTGYPLLADVVSGVRFGDHVADESCVLGAYETFLQADDPPRADLIVRFGAMPTSKQLGRYLAAQREATQITVHDRHDWNDPTYHIEGCLRADPAAMCHRLLERFEKDPPEVEPAWQARWRQLEQACWAGITEQLGPNFVEEGIVADVVDLMPQGGGLYVANSLPVRHLDQFAHPNAKRLRVLANRGASGIDGLVSSALGAAVALDVPLVLVTGDLAFYHDLGGLLAAKKYGIKLTIVVLNNDGGGIFYRLPISQFEPPFTELFVTPHGLDIEAGVRMYGLGYAKAVSREAFRVEFQQALAAEGTQVVEVPFDGKENHARYRALVEAVLERLEDGQSCNGERETRNQEANTQ